ncbi:MAG: hypothetical protein AB1918_19320 [Pseudomonadota bacterium]
MGSNYTPAPWRIRDAGNGIYDNTDDGVYDVVGRGPYGEITLAEEVDIHDARLIAAAPELLALLDRLVATWDNYEEMGPDPLDPIIEDARKLAAKARGEG